MFYILGDVYADNGVEYTVFVGNILQLAEQLKFLDPSYLMRDGEFVEMSDPEWLVAFRNYVENIYYTNSNAYAHVYNEDAGDIGVASIPYTNEKSETPNLNNNVGNFGDQQLAYNPNSKDGHYELPGRGDHGQFQQPVYTSNVNSIGTMPYDQQASYSPISEPLEQPTYSMPEAQTDDQPRIAMYPTNINVPSQQPPPSPGTSDGIGSASVEGSLQSSPVHSAPAYHEPTPAPQIRESSPNYFGKGNFQPQSALPNTVRKF